MDGICMEYVRDMHRICMEYVYMEYMWNMHGMREENLRNALGI